MSGTCRAGEGQAGFARVPAATGETVQVDIRGKLLTARVVKLSFVRNGKPSGDVAAAAAVSRG